MSQIINTNIASLNTQRNLNTSQVLQAQAIQRLSSGLRINSAKDDAAGLAISERFAAQINGLNQAVRNANDGISLSQTAEGALGSIGDALQRIRELAVQSANGTNSASDRAAIQSEVSQLVGEITRVGDTTNFNGLKILDGSYSSQFQVGANAGETIAVSVADTRGKSLGATAKTSTAGYDTTASLTSGITINGTAISTASATSLNDVISAVNAATGTTGVTASRATSNSFDLGALTAPTAGDTLTINGVVIAFAGSETKAAAANLINAVSSQTGVTADASGATIKLNSSTGGDITVQASTAADFANVGTGAKTYSAGLQLSTKLGGSVTVAGTLGTTLNLGGAATNYQVSSLDVSTVANANLALQTVDFALTQVNGTRAALGAIQSRFSAVVGSLQTASENLTASKSRITDADFAAETAKLTRANVLQQAGVAMLAQANALPNNVLALLK